MNLLRKYFPPPKNTFNPPITLKDLSHTFFTLNNTNMSTRTGQFQCECNFFSKARSVIKYDMSGSWFWVVEGWKFGNNTLVRSVLIHSTRVDYDSWGNVLKYCSTVDSDLRRYTALSMQTFMAYINLIGIIKFGISQNWS